MYTISTRPMTEVERASLRERLTEGFTPVNVLRVLLWSLLFGGGGLGSVLYAVGVSNLPPALLPEAWHHPVLETPWLTVMLTAAATAAISCRLIARAVQRDAPLRQTLERGVIDVWECRVDGVVAVDLGLDSDAETGDAVEPCAYDPAQFYWHFFAIAPGQLLCLFSTPAGDDEDGETAAPISSRFTIDRLPGETEILAVHWRTDAPIVPMRCRSVLLETEYEPDDGEIIAGTLETLDEDLRRLKAHPE